MIPPIPRGVLLMTKLISGSIGIAVFAAVASLSVSPWASLRSRIR
jgi:hypothetical protein